MGHSLNSVVQPWYRQGWPWFLIALPASAVIGGIITIILAVNSPNALVVDDYYKEAGWDEHGRPTRETLSSLGLDFAIKDIHS